MDQKKSKLIGNIAKLAIAIPGVILLFMIISNEKESTINAAINLTLVALVACAAIALIFGVLHFVGNVGRNKGMLIGLVAFLALLGVAYGMAGDEVTEAWNAAGITSDVSRRSGAGVYAVMLLLGVAVAAAIFSEVSSLLKR